MEKFYAFVNVLVFPLLSMGQIFNPIDTVICKGGNTSFISGSIYPSPSYQWQIKHKGIWVDVNNTAPFSGANTRTLRLTNVSDTLDKDSFKCKVYFNSNLVGISRAARLTVMAASTLPTSVFATVNPVNCPGGSTQLSLNGGSLSSGSSWKWYAGICGKNAVSSLVKPNLTTTYYVRAEGPCKDTSACMSVNVLVTNTNSIAPSSLMAGSDTICSGDSTVLSIIGGVLGSGAIWKWYSGGTCAVLIDSQGVSSLSVSPTSTATYSVKADGTCGSTVCKSVIVQVNQLPIVNAGNDTAVCKWSSIVLNPSVKGKNIYKWYPGTWLDDSSILRPNARPLTSSTYSLTVTDSNHCVKTDTVEVKVNALPSAQAGNDTSICSGGRAQLFASGGLNYSWSPVDGLNFPNSYNPVSTPLKTTIYKVRVTDQNQCSDSATVEVVLNPMPIINAIEDSSICEGNSIKLHSEGGIIYHWSPSTGLDSVNIFNPMATPLISTIYTVNVTNSYACSGTDTVIITVKPLPSANAGSDKVICLGDTVQLFTDPGTAYTFSWNPSLSLTLSNTRTPLAHPDTTTTYHVVVHLNGCKSQDSIYVIVMNGPAPVFTLFDSSVCKNASWIEYCLTPSSHLFRWSVQNGNIMSGQGTNCISVHWSETSSSGAVAVIDSLKNQPSCPVEISSKVTITDGPAPLPASVKVKNNNISTGTLICPKSSFKFYEWGFESKSSHTEQKSCIGDTQCYYSNGLDTLNYYYWVKVGDDLNCLTKSYFNRANKMNILQTDKSLSELVLYPNPITDKLMVESNLVIKFAIIGNIFGQTMFVDPADIHNNLMTIDMTDLSKGIYFISFFTDEGVITRKLLKD